MSTIFKFNMFQLGGAYWMAVAGTAATLLASSLTVISIKSLVTISFSHCSVLYCSI